MDYDNHSDEHNNDCYDDYVNDIDDFIVEGNNDDSHNDDNHED